MVDLSLSNENGGNLYVYIQTHEWCMPHNYSEVLLVLPALFVS